MFSAAFEAPYRLPPPYWFRLGQIDLHIASDEAFAPEFCHGSLAPAPIACADKNVMPFLAKLAGDLEADALVGPSNEGNAVFRGLHGEFLRYRLRGVLDGHAARGLNALGIAPAIVIGEQRSDHRADVIGHSDTPQRGHVGHTLVDFGIVPDHAAAKIGGYGTRCDDIDCYPARPQFFGHVLREHFDGPFHRTIRGAARKYDASEA